MHAASNEHADSGSERSDGPGGDASGLSERDAAILEFESHWMRHVGAKEAAIRERFQLSPARYYQLLGALIDSPVALAHNPMLIKRLQRTRDARLSARDSSAPGRGV